MKKTLLFVFATLFAYAVNAQVFLNEGFESGIPNTWSLIDNDGNDINWTDYVSLQDDFGWTLNAAPNSGSNFATSYSYLNVSPYGSYDQDNYLITPQVAIPASGATLSFFVRSDLPNYPDDYMVKLSTTTNSSVSAFSVELKPLTTAGGSWEQVQIDLAAYAGQSVYIAFVHQCSDMVAICLDDVKIYSLSNTPEITMSYVTLPDYGYAGEDFVVKGTVLNVSSQTLTSFDVTYTIDNGSASAVYSATCNVAGGDSYEFTHNVPANIAAGGNHTIAVTVSNPNGTADATADNTASGTIEIVPCTAVTTFPYQEGFEDVDVLHSCWRTVSVSGTGDWSDAAGLIAYYGEDYAFEANSGDDAAISMGDAGDINMFMSPAFTLPADAPAIGFKYYDYLSNTLGQYDGTQYQLYLSNTGTAVGDFTTLLGTYDLTEHEYTQRVIDLTAYAGQTIYIAFMHYVDAYMMIDDISVEIADATPEIALNSIDVPSLTYVGDEFEISGTIVNNSATALNNFKVQYSVGGAASQVETITINGGLAFGETYDFTCTAPATTTQDGELAVTVTVSEPNGTADNVADNSLNDTIISIACHDITEFPYDEDFEGDYGIYSSCWKGDWSMAYPYIYNYGQTMPFAANSGIDAAISAGAAGAENWMISPDIHLPANASEITFSFYDYLSYDQQSLGATNYSVMVSTTGNAPANFTTTLYDGTVDVSDFTERTVDLTQYKGQTINLAFVHTIDAWMIIDDLNITVNTGSGPIQGINDVNAANVSIYPNPTSGNLYVDVEGLQKVEIIDAVGRVVMSQNNGNVNMSELANGIYTVRVSANGTTTIKKVVKK